MVANWQAPHLVVENLIKPDTPPTTSGSMVRFLVCLVPLSKLFAALGELELDAGQREPAASAAAALPALAYLPPAGSKALPAHGAAAVGEVEDAELERIKCSM